MNVNVKGLSRFPWLISPNGIFIFIFLLTILDRVFLITVFGSQWTSNDDLIFWLGAHDYSRGIFHEPFMYGQDYNYMLESLLAAPFVKCGIPYHVLMPCITSFMALFPFWTFGREQMRKQNFNGAFFLAAIPLFLPIEFGVMTTITRGFINGIFVLGFFPLVQRVNKEYLKWLLGGFIIALACVVNPNALVLAVPLLFLVWTEEFRKWKFYLLTICGMLLPLILFYLSKQYYVLHPEVVVHSLDGGWRMGFHPGELIPESLANLDDMFRYLGIFWWKNGTILPVVLLIAAIIFFFKKMYDHGFIILIALSIIVFSFAFPKVHDGFDTVFYSNSRNYLAAPLLLGIAVAALFRAKTQHKYFTAVIAVVAIGFFSGRLIAAKSVIQEITSRQFDAAVPLTIIDNPKLEHEAATYDSLAKKYNAGLLIFMNGPGMPVAKAQFISIGGELLRDHFPLSYIPQYERRSWIRSQAENGAFRNILFIGTDANVRQKIRTSHPDAQLVDETRGIIFISDNVKPLRELWPATER